MLRTIPASWLIVSAVLTSTWMLSPSACAQDSSGDTLTLFNGKDLSGWIGREDLWQVEEGMIVGRTTAEDPIKTNTFLIYTGELPSDFELVAQFKIEGGNSGIQYRSRIVDQEQFIVGGYQADIDFGNTYAGILYEERGRGILAQRGEKVTIDASGEKDVKVFADSKALAKGIHPGEWNEFRVVAKGNRLQHFINGALTIEVVDQQQDKASDSGVIALQLHQGPAMTVRFKNLTLEGI